MGNHDVGQTEELERAGFTERHWAVVLDTDPPAALTHAPLKRRPIPAVNIHGTCTAPRTSRADTPT